MIVAISHHRYQGMLIETSRCCFLLILSITRNCSAVVIDPFRNARNANLTTLYWNRCQYGNKKLQAEGYCAALETLAVGIAKVASIFAGRLELDEEDD